MFFWRCRLLVCVACPSWDDRLSSDEAHLDAPRNALDTMRNAFLSIAPVAIFAQQDDTLPFFSVSL